MDTLSAPSSPGLAPRPLPPGARDEWPAFLRTMFGVGLNSFGGPVAQIGHMHRVAVEREGWVTEEQFVHLLNFANILPGPEALELAIHLGYLRRGRLGGVAAGLLFIWPGFVCLTALAWVYVNFGSLAWMGHALTGIRAVAVALICAAAMRLASKSMKQLGAQLLMLLAFTASFAFGVPFLLLLVGCGGVGLLVSKRRGPALGRYQNPLAFLVLLFVLGAGFLHSGLPAPSHGSAAPSPAGHPLAERTDGTLAEIGWLNTKAALLTFGGAYTVLPYFREQMVERKGWLSDRQVADALALGETTPGPLVSVGVFLAFLVGGLEGAVVSAFFLFLPSFLLVLGLGRYIERIENLRGAGNFLWGVSAGTLGLILSMAAQLVPANLPSIPSAVLALVAFVGFWKWRLNPFIAVTSGALLGLLAPWFR